MIGAAAVTRLDVIDDARIVDEDAIHRFVAQISQSAPSINIGLNAPDMIRTDTFDKICISKTDKAFARRRIIVEQSREAGRGVEAVGGGNVKGDDGTGGLARNGRAVDAIANDGVSTRAVVSHLSGGVRGGRIE